MTSYEFYGSDTKTRRYIYLDNNVFRLLIRNKDFWNNFFEFFNKEAPGLFDDIKFIFTWMQLLEAIDLGSIITEIKKGPLWKKTIEGKNIFIDKDIDTINESLDKYFNTFCTVARQYQDLQQAALLKKITNALSYANLHSMMVVEETLLKVKKFIDDDSYMDDLVCELGWAFITSNYFIMSEKQYVAKKAYFDSLISGWHKLFQSGHELQFARLAERAYYSSNLHEDQTPNKLKLRPEDDLCDGEIIHYSCFGFKMKNFKKRHPVIGITFDSSETTEQRRNIINQTMINLKCNVEGWDIRLIPGTVFALNKKNNNIISHKKISFRTP